jgi:uncharacterized membrane protein YiaA
LKVSPYPQPLSLTSALYWFAALAVITVQGALGVTLLVALRRWRHEGAGLSSRWAKMTWASFLVSALGFVSLSALPLPFALSALLELTLFVMWVSRAARWAAQE